MLPDLHGLPYADLEALLDRLGVGARHASRVFRGIHRDGRLLGEIPDLGRHARTIAGACETTRPALEEAHRSADGTEKLVFRLRDGARVEGVLIPMRPGRVTMCVSSQVGCAMACAFCATGTLGLKRGLEAGEIVGQVHAARARLAPRGERLTRLVFMGMGEPLHHYDATRDAIRVLLDDHGLSFAADRITVSTVGLVGRMRQLGEDFGGRLQVALSLHAGTDATRRRIVPLAAKHPLEELRRTCLEMRRSTWLMLEYVLLPGVNDGEDDLLGLAAFTRDLRAIVNLIPFNPFPGAGFRSPTGEETARVAERLRALDVPVSVRWPRGRQAAGACGQLALLGGEASG